MRNVIVDLGFSVVRINIEPSKIYPPDMDIPITLTLMTPANTDEGTYLPATSAVAYMSLAQAKALAAALTDPLTDSEVK